MAVVSYQSEVDTYQYLHQENTFIFLVTTREQYHQFKHNAKISPACVLLVETEGELPEDELYLYRICRYAVYYGPNGMEYLRRIRPRSPPPMPFKFKYLFYGMGEEDIAFWTDYDEYEKIFFKNWE